MLCYGSVYIACLSPLPDTVLCLVHVAFGRTPQVERLQHQAHLRVSISVSKETYVRSERALHMEGQIEEGWAIGRQQGGTE